MPSTYPNALDNLATSRNPTDLVGPDVLLHADAINQIEIELGINPSSNWYPTVKARLDGIELPAFNFQTGTTYTLGIGDQSKIVSMNNSAANSLLVPTNANIGFSVGTQITIRQAGTGTTTVSAVTPATTTIHSRGSIFTLAGQWAYASLIKVGTDTWDLTGDLG